MKYFIIGLAFLVQFTFAEQTLTDSSFNGIYIGEQASSAIKKLKGYREAKLEPDAVCYYFSDSAEIPSTSFMVLNGRVERIDVEQGGQKIQTSSGITVGSKKSEVLAKYKSVKVSPHPYIAPEGEYLEVKLTNGFGLIFETNKNIITSFRLGSYPAITYIEGCE